MRAFRQGVAAKYGRIEELRQRKRLKDITPQPKVCSDKRARRNSPRTAGDKETAQVECARQGRAPASPGVSMQEVASFAAADAVKITPYEN